MTAYVLMKNSRPVYASSSIEHAFRAYQHEIRLYLSELAADGSLDEDPETLSDTRAVVIYSDLLYSSQAPVLDIVEVEGYVHENNSAPSGQKRVSGRVLD